MKGDLRYDDFKFLSGDRQCSIPDRHAGQIKKTQDPESEASGQRRSKLWVINPGEP